MTAQEGRLLACVRVGATTWGCRWGGIHGIFRARMVVLWPCGSQSVEREINNASRFAFRGSETL